MPERPVPTILHVDLDAFFAAVEVLDDPSLAGRPVIVGGTGSRGVVAACTYEARVHGVASAMATARARRLCPHAVFLAGRYQRYQEVSARFLELLGRCSPVVEPVSMDEAFLDASGGVRLFGPGPRLARLIRRTVTEELGLAASVGVAPTKMLAKMASEAAKPKVAAGRLAAGKGVVVVEPGGELAFLHPHPIRALWGVGPATARRLEALGVTTVGDLSRVPLQALVGAVGQAAGRHLHDLARGLDPRPVVASRPARSIGHERTFSRDLVDRATLDVELQRLADAVAQRMRAGGLEARTVTVKIRFGDFRTISRSVTPPEPVAERTALARSASRLLAAVEVSPGVRLLGVSVRNLVPVGGDQAPGDQMSLAVGPSEQDREWEPVARAVDLVRSRFGDAAVASASMLGGAGIEVHRRGHRQWGPSD